MSQVPLFSVRQAYDWLPSATLTFASDTSLASAVLRVSTDTRAIRAGDLFVALRGERFDAHDFIEAAMNAGAVALMVDRQEVVNLARNRVPVLWVPDTRSALGQLAQAWRKQFTIPVIAVTGSNGKTTVKEMIASILRSAFGDEQAWATPGNLNNEIGLPLAIFGLGRQHRAAVFELGMNHPGEIAGLTKITQPTVALVNNAQREHQEFMQTVEAVARENGAVLQGLTQGGVAVYPADDAHTWVWDELLTSSGAGGLSKSTFGFNNLAAGVAPQFSAPAGSRAEKFELTQSTNQKLNQAAQSTSCLVELSIAGGHNVRNALAAAAATNAIGISLEQIARGLKQFKPVSGRLVQTWLPSASLLIDDTYNANPDSVRAAIDVLAERDGFRILILGDMGEVGDQGPVFHRECGAYAAARGVQQLWAVGELSQHLVAAYLDAGSGAGLGAAQHFSKVEDLIVALDQANVAQVPRATILVKGSRFMKMERVVDALSKQSFRQSEAANAA
jgi:UDP-N-acetylmuramoyl-tripeptide--D-alanyl-D-alanine ligase